MRVLHRVIAIGFAGALVAAPVSGQKSDDQINPTSVELLKQGDALIASGRLMDAHDVLETALAVDPRNRAAFVSLARVAQKQKLYGKAIRLTNKALALEPTDRAALAVQGEAMVELGALPRARQNLARLQQLCGTGCPEATVLASAISRGSTVAQAKAPTVPKTN